MEHIDDTPQGKLMHGVHSALAEYYVENLAWEVKKGTKQKVMRGGTANRAALGYRNVGVITNDFEERVVVVDETRAAHIVWMFEQYATGEWSFHLLAEAVTARGLTTRATKGRPAGPINFKQVQQILANKYYTGVVTHGGVEYPGKHQPLITEELFARVQEVIQAHRNAGERSYQHHHYLAGSLRCARCGYALVYNVITGKGGRYDYFTCIGRHTYKNGCALPYLPVEQVEAAVEGVWRFERLTETQVSQLKTDLLVLIDTQEAEDQHETRIVDQRIAAVKAERVKWAEAAVNGTAPADVVADKQAHLGQQLLALTTRRAQMIEVGSHHRANLDRIIWLFSNCGEGYQVASPPVRRLYNQAWFTHLDIDCDPDEASVIATSAERAEPFNTLREAASRPKHDLTDPNRATDGSQTAQNSVSEQYDQIRPNRAELPSEQGKQKTLSHSACTPQDQSAPISKVDHLVGMPGFEPGAPCSKPKDVVKFQ
jgi:hypothetical protein